MDYSGSRNRFLGVSYITIKPRQGQGQHLAFFSGVQILPIWMRKYGTGQPTLKTFKAEKSVDYWDVHGT